ncbi:MAG: FkbM family methyltransferase [Candidatus Dependentiae bacterium]
MLPYSPIVLESGGYFGEDTIRIKHIFPDAEVHVFEPLPSSFEVMEKETENLSDVIRYPYALTNYSGKIPFLLLVVLHWNEHAFDKTPIQVPCVTINDWATKNNISHIDFMWLDMEGNELCVLQKSLDILHTVKAIYTEISFCKIRETSCKYIYLKAFLKRHGFH